MGRLGALVGHVAKPYEASLQCSWAVWTLSQSRLRHISNSLGGIVCASWAVSGAALGYLGRSWIELAVLGGLGSDYHSLCSPSPLPWTPAPPHQNVIDRISWFSPRFVHAGPALLQHPSPRTPFRPICCSTRRSTPRSTAPPRIPFRPICCSTQRARTVTHREG